MHWETWAQTAVDEEYYIYQSYVFIDEETMVCQANTI